MLMVCSIRRPSELHAYDVTGRAWTIDELRHKSWDDLHALWWVCLKDMNRTLTSKIEAERVKAGYGEFEADERIKTVCQAVFECAILAMMNRPFTRRYERQ